MYAKTGDKNNWQSL